MKFKKYWWAIPILAAAVYIVILNVKVNRLMDDKQLQAVELSTLKDTVLTVVTRNGQLISTVASVEVEKDNLKESLRISGIDIKKLKDENIKWRNLNYVLQMQLSAAGHGETIIRDTFRVERTDTIYYSKVGNWTNDYLSLFNAKVETGKLFFDYSYKTGIKIFQESERKGTTVTIKLSDPNAIITTANSITVVPKKTIWHKWWLWTAIGAAGGIFIAK